VLLFSLIYLFFVSGRVLLQSHVLRPLPRPCLAQPTAIVKPRKWLYSLYWSR